MFCHSQQQHTLQSRNQTQSQAETRQHHRFEAKKKTQIAGIHEKKLNENSVVRGFTVYCTYMSIGPMREAKDEM